MIRPATHADIHKIIALAEAMHGESRYAAHPWDTRKVGDLVRGLVESPDGFAMVAERDGELIGGMLAVVAFAFYSSVTRVAEDFGIFVLPGKRGGLAGSQLLEAYLDWARGKGAIPRAGITTGIAPEQTARLFAAHGFTAVGTIYEHQGK